MNEHRTCVLKADRARLVGSTLTVLLHLTSAVAAADDGRRILAQGAEVYGPVTPYPTPALRDQLRAAAWQPGDPIKEVPRRFYPIPGSEARELSAGLPDPLIDLQTAAAADRSATTTIGVNVDGLGFSGVLPPDTVGDVGPDHYVQAVNATNVAIYDKTGTLLPGYPIRLASLAPEGHSCNTNAHGDPIVLYDWLADRWFLQEFTTDGQFCIYVSTSDDPTGSYYFYSFSPPSFPDYPHFGVWGDAYYGTTNEDGNAGNQTTYALKRAAMLEGDQAIMQRMAVVPPLSGYGFQTLTPADHDGDVAMPDGTPGLFMRHNDDEAHGDTTVPAEDYLELYEMTVDWEVPANTTVTALTPVAITDFNSWMVDYSTFFSVPQPNSGGRLDPIREVVLNRLAYRNFGGYEVLVGNLATNRDPATSGDHVEAANRWFELRRSGGSPWTLQQEGTFGGDTGSPTANFFMGGVAMDGKGNIALGYSKTDIGYPPVHPSIGFTGRLADDAAGTMGPESLAVAGIRSLSSNGRWGDYAAMSVDPADDCTFWYTNEYMTAGFWGTRIVSFFINGCFPTFALSPLATRLDVCALFDPDLQIDVEVTAIGGWSHTVTLAATGEPPGTTTHFETNGVAPDFTSVFNVSGVGNADSGTYAIDVSATGGDQPPTLRDTQVILNLTVADPGAPVPTSPVNGATGVSLFPELTWSAAHDAATYALEVATDDAFNDVVYTATTGLTGLSVPTELAPGTTYFWRLTAENLCGASPGATSRFTTVPVACQLFDSTDVPKPIPEGGGSYGTTESTLNVADAGVVADVNVLDLTGTHTYMGDLAFVVESPATTSVQVISRSCGDTDDFDLNLDNEVAAGAWPCPPTDGGTYRPSSPLSAFSGENSAGTWTLSIIDYFTEDTGRLDNWRLEICIERTVDIFADGFEAGDMRAWSSTTADIFADGLRPATQAPSRR